MASLALRASATETPRANIPETIKDTDTTAYALHAWLNIVESSEENVVPRKKIKEIEKRLEGIDPFAKTFNKLSSDYLKELFKIEKFFTGRYPHVQK